MTQLTMKDKIGYGLGDTACGFVWQATMFLLAYFYTDVFGLSAGIMGTLFLVSRVLDAVTDPLMGLLVDRTRTRHGQFRPFLLWGAIPFGIVCVLTFYTPDFSAQGKIIYACVTYILLTLVYTFVNVPYCAMPGVITADPKASRPAILAFLPGGGGFARHQRHCPAAGQHHRQRGRAGGLFRRHVRAGAERRGAALRLLLYHQRALHL